MLVDSRYDLESLFNGPIAAEELIDRRRHGKDVIYEGTDGKFSQTWWPLCRSSDLPAGKVLGRNFLDGRVAVYRTEDGIARVVSAFCPHNGADLSVGSVQGDQLVCAFHRWEFGGDGRCTRTASGDPVVNSMRVFAYPVQERFGLVWAFNGEEPLFDLPTLALPDDELAFHDEIPIIDLMSDPWVFMCNTSDFNHLVCVHGLHMDDPDPADKMVWHDHGYDYSLTGSIPELDTKVEIAVGIRGTNIFYQTGTVNGQWFAYLYACGMHRPGTLRSYSIIATRKSDGTPEGDRAVQETLDFAMQMELAIVMQDAEILNTIRFTRGTFTRSDKALGRFLDYLKKYPRAHPGAAFIK